MTITLFCHHHNLICHHHNIFLGLASQMAPDEFANVIQDRDKAMENIEHTMIEVNDIYRDLSSLVHDQGKMLDSIEANIDNSDQRIDAGIDELNKVPHAELAQKMAADVIFVGRHYVHVSSMMSTISTDCFILIFQKGIIFMP